MYLRNQKHKKSNDKKTIKPLNTSVYSKIKNKKRSSKKQNSEITIPEIPKLSAKSNNEIERYFIKTVSEKISRNNRSFDDGDSGSNEKKQNKNDKKSEIDIINKYMDSSRITAFSNYLTAKEFPKINTPSSEVEPKIQQNESSSRRSDNLSATLDEHQGAEDKYSVDYLVKEFAEPFEKNKKYNLKRLAIIRKDLREAYELNFVDESPKESFKKNFVDSEAQTSFVIPSAKKNDPSSFAKNTIHQAGLFFGKTFEAQSNTVNNEFKPFQFGPTVLNPNYDLFSKKTEQVTIVHSNPIVNESKDSFKTKLKLSQIKLEDLYYD